ncbi:MAG: type III pantothenate kinase [Bacteroidales bacterium]|nr:type III pantothenate kinase [Bacteroidales bacterium]
MNLAIDIGNSNIKWALFDGDKKVEQGEGIPPADVLKTDNSMICASGDIPDELKDIPRLDSNTPLPITSAYDPSAALGADRIADACGAWSLHPGKDCLVIDAGTCITVDFVDKDGIFRGGAIMPGLKMKLQALHNFTAHLPFIDISQYTLVKVTGRNTEDCIVSGTLGATLLALAGYVTCYRVKHPEMHVIVTGGDAMHLLASGNNQWEHVPGLALIGMNHIMNLKQ